MKPTWKWGWSTMDNGRRVNIAVCVIGSDAFTWVCFADGAPGAASLQLMVRGETSARLSHVFHTRRLMLIALEAFEAALSLDWFVERYAETAGLRALEQSCKAMAKVGE